VKARLTQNGTKASTKQEPEHGNVPTPAYSGGPLRVRAKVRNRIGYSLGVEFLQDTGTPRQQAARLRELLISVTGCSA
jgi:hypothetical protein